jgi:uncharacterized OB-fold protein
METRTETMAESPFRVLPTTEEPSEFFWTSGADGCLRFLRCSGCSYFVHPPAPYCPSCGGRDCAPAVVSGRGTVYSFTVNHQPWDGSPDPYIIAVVEMDEQPGLRLMTNVIDIATDDIRIGMPVEVAFEHHDRVHIPLFRPVAQ